MPELKREPTPKDLEFARKPLKQIDPKRVAAYEARRRNIEAAYNRAIRKLERQTDDWRVSNEKANEAYAEINFLQSEKTRKLEQLQTQYEDMVKQLTLAWLKENASYVLDSKIVEGLSKVGEVASRAKDAYEIASHTALISQFGATGLLMTNPFTATLAVLNLADQWIGRAIGWIQMAKKQWDADCSRISVRLGKKIAAVYNDSEFHMSRTTGSVFAGADKSTIARQTLEKKLYHKIKDIREDVIKYKIVTVEKEREALLLQQQGKQIEKSILGVEANMKRLKSQGLDRGHYARNYTELQQKHTKVMGEFEKVQHKMVNVLNEIVENNSRLVNQAQVDVDKMIDEVLKSFQKTDFQGKFTGDHTHGSWRLAIRRAFS